MLGRLFGKKVKLEGKKKKKFHLASRNIICKDFKGGILEVKDLESFEKTLIARQAAKLYLKPESIWVRIMRDKYKWHTHINNNDHYNHNLKNKTGPTAYGMIGHIKCTVENGLNL